MEMEEIKIMEGVVERATVSGMKVIKSYQIELIISTYLMTLFIVSACF